MRIKYKKSAYRSLDKFQSNERKKLLNKISQLAEYPASGKKLKGKYEGLRSLRVWPFRVVYEIRNSTIVILSIIHRQSAYKKSFN